MKQLTEEQAKAETERMRDFWAAFGRHDAKKRAERAVAPPLSDSTLLRMRIDESRAACDPMLALFLGTAVPLWIDQMKNWAPSVIQQTAHDLVDIVTSSQGIAAMVDPDARGTERKGELAKAFNAVAQGLACLAFCPGGIVFGGHHWEVPRD